MLLISAGPDEEQYIVPEFLISSLHQIFDGYRKKLDSKTYGPAVCVSIIFSFKSSRPSSRPKLPLYLLFLLKVHQFNSHSFGVICEGKIMAPTVPVSKNKFFSIA